jgi:phosphatidylinositol-3-phosphatase
VPDRCNIVPDRCNDGHDSCAPYHDPVKQTDAWLQNNVPAILSSAAYKNGGALFITWDEAASGDGPIGMIVLSPYARNGYSNTIPYTHSSTLRTLEEIYGVSPLLGDAAHATDLRDLFTTFPQAPVGGAGLKSGDRGDGLVPARILWAGRCATTVPPVLWPDDVAEAPVP